MHLSRLLLITILILCFSNSYSQTSAKKNQLEFSTGYNSSFLKNLALAPLSRYAYRGLNYQLEYSRITKKGNLLELRPDYLKSSLESDLIPTLNIEDYSKYVLNFSYLKRIYNENKLAIHLGLQSQTYVSYYFNRRLYDFQQKLGISGRFSYKIDEKQSLSSQLTLPFMMWRTSTFEESFYSLKRYQSAIWSTEYKYKLSNRFDMKANYNFNYDRLQTFNAYRELQYQINLGISYKF